MKEDSNNNFRLGGANNLGRDLCPEGYWNATINRFENLGAQKGQYDNEPKLKFKAYFVVHASGRDYLLSKLYNQALGENSAIAQVFHPLLGRPVTDDELRNGIDVTQLIGVNCIVQVKHKKKPTGTYDNIVSVTPPIPPPAPPAPPPPPPPQPAPLASPPVSEDAKTKVYRLIGDLIDSEDDNSDSTAEMK